MFNWCPSESHFIKSNSAHFFEQNGLNGSLATLLHVGHLLFFFFNWTILLFVIQKTTTSVKTFLSWFTLPFLICWLSLSIYLGMKKVKSPTFSLVEEYKYNKIDITHIDLYRIKTIDELHSIGFFEYLDSKNLWIRKLTQHFDSILFS